VALWTASPGVVVHVGDDLETFARYLRRNRGCSWAAVAGGVLVGTVMGGHDGRRGLIIHLAVAEAFQRRGIGRELVHRAMAGLHRAGVPRVRVDVLASNPGAVEFWNRLGYEAWNDVVTLSAELRGLRTGDGAGRAGAPRRPQGARRSKARARS
jgi:ribosomal protein S18 acetylase RimI-like enzyme